MSHDVIAELAAYQSELANYERAGRGDRAAAVRAQMDQVIAEVLERVETLLAQAEGHEDAGRDVPAAQARVEAKRLARALPPDKRPAKLRPLFPDAAGAEDAVASEPSEKAVPRRRGKEG